MSDDALEEALRALRREYLAAGPARLGELWSALERVQNGDAGALSELRTFAHRLAGSGGGYGFPEISRTARLVDEECRAHALPPFDVVRLRQLIQALADAFAHAQPPE